jgi:hypothetical protein
VASIALIQLLARLRALEDARAEAARAIDTAVAALAGPEYLGFSRRAELAALLTKGRLALEDTCA